MELALGGLREAPATLQGPSGDPPGTPRSLPEAFQDVVFQAILLSKFHQIFRPQDHSCYHLGSTMAQFGVKNSRHNCALNF